MQPTKQTIPDHDVTQNTLADGQDLLRQSLSLFDMQVIPPVEMAFPHVISDTTTPAIDSAASDVNQLFAQQEQLFSGIAEPVEDIWTGPDNNTSSMTEPQASAEPAELQTIRQMYEQS